MALYAAMRVRRGTSERAIHARVYGHAVKALQAALLGTALLASFTHLVSILNVLDPWTSRLLAATDQPYFNMAESSYVHLSRDLEKSAEVCE